MTLGITATFPLGVYQGHRSDGTAEPLPDPARLHAALLCAAAQGPRALEVNGRTEPRAADVHALNWLEENTPSGIRVPEHQPVAPRRLTAFRKDGVIVKEAGRVVDKVISRDQSDGYAVNGAVGWCWDDMPDDVRESLTALCPDVPCLGEATSPVRLSIDDVEPTLHIDPHASVFDPVGEDVRVAAPNRTQSLRNAYDAQHGRPPSETQDRHSVSSDQPRPAPVAADGLRTARYRPAARVEAAVPWSQVLLLPTTRPIAVHERVPACVAAHRALISRIGTGASAMVTGVYESATARPANRLAIHYIAGDVLRQHGHGDTAAFALFIPQGASALDRAQLASALHGWRTIARSGGSITLDDREIVSVDGAAFWSPVSSGLVRTWVTHPAAVPETRPMTVDGGRRWTLADAAALSVGMVWRDELGAATLRGPAQYRHLRSAVDERRVRVLEITAVNPKHARSFVHATPAGLVVQPYRARLTVGTLAGDRTAIAIGQSRHLGGGLLIPCDLVPDLVPGRDEAG